jgi:UDP:flavonoid glycosyltransferase YjiC (YdhE family)
MRILFSTTPALGHVLPLLPLARALSRRGHTVGFVTAAAMRSPIEDEGFEPLAAGPTLEVLFAEVARRTGTDPAADPTPTGADPKHRLPAPLASGL